MFYVSFILYEVNAMHIYPFIFKSYIISDVKSTSLFWCTCKMHDDEWGIIQKVFKQTFDIACWHFVKTTCLIKTWWKKTYRQILSKITVWKPCTGPLAYVNFIRIQIRLSCKKLGTSQTNQPTVKGGKKRWGTQILTRKFKQVQLKFGYKTWCRTVVLTFRKTT